MERAVRIDVSTGLEMRERTFSLSFRVGAMLTLSSMRRKKERLRGLTFTVLLGFLMGIRVFHRTDYDLKNILWREVQ